MQYATDHHFNLTFRQVEFCRHYARGLSCSEAARCAGYSESFISKKAHLLLRHPGLAFKIRELQHANSHVAAFQYTRAVSEFYDILENSGSEMMRFRAAREIARLFLRQPMLPERILEGAEVPENQEERIRMDQEDPQYSQAVRIEQEAQRVEDFRAQGHPISPAPAPGRTCISRDTPPADPTDDLVRISPVEKPKSIAPAQKQKVLPAAKPPEAAVKSKALPSSTAKSLLAAPAKVPAPKPFRPESSHGQFPDEPPSTPAFSLPDALQKARALGIFGDPRYQPSVRNQMIKHNLIPEDFT